MPLSTGPDGIDVNGYGWTNQSATFQSNKSLESYGAASSSIINSSLRQGYSAWTYDPIYATGSPASAATTMAALIYVPASFACTHVAVIPVATAGNLTVAIWPSTAPAGTATPLAFTAATSAVLAGVNSLTWSGSSSPTSVNLTGGQSYMVTVYSSAATTVACLVADAAYTANAAVPTTYGTTTTYRSASVATLTTVSTTSTFGTSTLSATIPWVALY